MKKREFVQHGKPLLLTVSGEKHETGPARRFSSGKMGWNVNRKVIVTLPDGSRARCQFSGNLVLIGSDLWADGASEIEDDAAEADRALAEADARAEAEADAA